MSASLTFTSTAMGALIIGAIWGVLWLFFGAALLRPMIVLAAILVGVIVGVVAARAWIPEAPLWAAAATGGVLGLIAGALLYRPVVATAAALVGGTAGAIVAWAVIAGGALDAPTRDSGHALAAVPPAAAQSGESARSSAELLAIFSAAPATSADLPAAASAGDRTLRELSDIAKRATQRTAAALSGTAPAYRTLLYGCVATGAVIGLIAGLLATTVVARVLTSMAGAWLLLVCGVPLMASAGYAPLPPTARAWVIASIALVLIGVAVQSLIARNAPATKRPAKRIERAQPAPA